MLSARLLAELSDVAARDARASVDPRETDNCSELAVERPIGLSDWAESAYLERLSMDVWRAALMRGWQPYFSPWLSDEENEEIQCDVWERLLP